MKTTIARRYENMNGQTCLELVKTGRKFLIAVNGQIRDSRRTLTADEAREWYDAASVRIGKRP